MATRIRQAPTLFGDSASNFNGQADESMKLKNTIDFSKQVKICCEILKKSNK